MPEELKSAAISAGGGVFGSLISGLFNMGEARKNRQFQERMYKMAVENNRQDATTAFQRQQELMSQNVEHQRNLRQTAFQDTVKGAKDAGVNIGMALAGGALGAQGAGGVAAPEASAASSPSGAQADMAPIDLAGLGEIASRVELNKALADQARSNAAEKRGETAPSQVSMEQTRQNIAESQERVNTMLVQQGLITAQTKNTESQTTWQDIQNKIAEATSDEQIQQAMLQTSKLENEIKLLLEQIDGSKIDNQNKQALYDQQFQLFNAQV